ncbi:type II toxin-antitoxin system RelB/DinJ family antitoxin [Geobacter grbiciae]|uniref:type II toxin-antitoxin system RelB/DinJ family antitoxin n=1 Tax=Geobacter grbiciae TaxID=155042 RepID=UPI001C0228C2|nr:type II toxin-antitoxin system RelB/DinJ family antitoxin [Geobacter grbiciae]MBT1074652.1 type II toxin-antitoxin system RelB/DinJ family antitoxin [Geobacter grbiciae]
MPKNSTICLRIDSQLKQESEAVLRRLGLSTSEAIKIFLSAVRNRKGLPFPVQLEDEQASVSPAVPGRRQAVVSLRGQYREMPLSEEFSRRKQEEIDHEESRLRL